MSWARHRYGAEFAAWLGRRLRADRPGRAPRRGGRRRPAARRWLRRSGLVGAGVARQPRRRLLPRGRRRRSRGSSTATSSTGRSTAPLIGRHSCSAPGSTVRIRKMAAEPVAPPGVTNGPGQDPGTGVRERHERDPREPHAAGRGRPSSPSRRRRRWRRSRPRRPRAWCRSTRRPCPGSTPRSPSTSTASSTLDVHSPAFAAKAGDVASMGDDDIRAAAETSNRLLSSPVRAMQAGPAQRGRARSRRPCSTCGAPSRTSTPSRRPAPRSCSA